MASLAPSSRAVRDLVLPPSALGILRRAVAGGPGEASLLEALRLAGREAGVLALPLVERESGGRGPDAFWDRLTRVLARRGWGTFTHRRVHPGLALLESPDAAEAVSGDPRGAGCPFTTGMLVGLLSEAAGRAVEVVEVRCGQDGGAPCTWAFGAPVVLERLRQGLERGDGLEDILRGL